MKLYGDRIYGFKVSDYGLEHGYLDYYTLSEILGDCILNNTIIEETSGYWEVANGDIYDEETDEYYDIYQYYIITDRAYNFLAEHTDEIVFYNEKLDMYLWGITHFGTAWDYVLTDIPLEK